MSNSKKTSNQGTSENSLFNRLIVPVLLTLVAGGTAPWWIGLVRSDNDRAKLIEPSKTQNAPEEEFGDTEAIEKVQDDTRTNIQGSENDVKNTPTKGEGSGNVINDSSVRLQGEGDQAVIQGSGNNTIQGSDNQLTIQQDSEARSRGELEIPSIYGLGYHEAREKLTDSGWIPQTQRHTYGATEPGLRYGNGQVFWDMGYWEVVSCSGIAEGFCRFEFEDPAGRRLVIITAGMEDRSRSIEAQINRVFFAEDSL